MTSMRRWLIRALVLLALLAFSTGIASAHAALVKSDPAPNAVLSRAPAQVQLWFDEEVDPRFSEIQVLDASRTEVQTGPVQPAPGDPRSVLVSLKPLGNGSYTVVWKVLSATDGHITRGVFAFAVGQGASVTSSAVAAGEGTDELNPFSIGVRWLSLLALLALAGGLFFRVLLLDRSFRALAAAPPDPDPSVDARPLLAASAESVAVRWWQLTALILAIALLANLAELVVQADLITGRLVLDLVVGVLFSTRYGTLWLGRMLLLALISVLLLAGDGHRRLAWLLPALGVLALLTRSLGSHGAAAQGDVSLAVLSDWLHLAAVSIWVGGLIYFALLLRPIWRALGPALRGRWIAQFISRFSVLALAATPVIALTGIYNSLLQVPALDDLIRTLYGTTLVAKVALFGLMIVFGALNLLLVGPRFRRAVSTPAQSARVLTRFRLTLAAEVILGVEAIFLAGLLTLEPPARQQAVPVAPGAAPESRLAFKAAAAPDANVSLVVVGGEFDARVTDANGGPTANILRVIFNFVHLDGDTGIQTVIAEPRADGEYVAAGNYTPLDGMWLVRVIVRRKGVEDVSVEFPLYVPSQDTSPDEHARELLADSDARMNRLVSLRMDQVLNDGANGVAVTHYEYRAPDRLRFTVVGASRGLTATSIAVGRLQYYQEPSGEWTVQSRVDPFVFPHFDRATQAQWARHGRTDTVGGEPAQVVRYATADSSSNGSIQYADWISTSDGRLLKQAMVADGHYMMQTYYDFDAPDITIEAPQNVATPTSAPTPPAGPAAAAPLTGPHRLPGLVTGDLEGDGALILLVAGIAAALAATVKRLSPTLRLTALGLAAACSVAGVAMFLDAVSATSLGAAAAPVDMARANRGRALYDEYCVSCHGPAGRGDGPAGAQLPVKPTDLTTHVLQHDEMYLHSVILDGRGYMPPFGNQLSQDEILDLIAYIRLLAVQASPTPAGP